MEATVLADIIVEIDATLALKVENIIAFLIIFLPLMLNYCRKSLFYVKKKRDNGKQNYDSAPLFF